MDQEIDHSSEYVNLRKKNYKSHGTNARASREEREAMHCWEVLITLEQHSKYLPRDAVGNESRCINHKPKSVN